MFRSRWSKIILVIILILIVDQVSKFIVKTNMHLGESIPIIGQWSYIHFIENNGMAFGFEFGGQIGKIFLTLFRVAAVTGLIFFINSLVKKGAPIGFLIPMGLITAGAAGNIIDSCFYGMIFSESAYGSHMIDGSGIATLFPEGGGYGKFLQGKVVDMFYFPLLTGQYPEWFPIKAGDPFIFFRPVFNVADSAITVGVAWILIFQRKYLRTIG